ncbi:double-strand-specific ribonuclease Pac1 [Schizosaccharomyces cryophilus OY26]|uniref:ribonuclease III n=1 Tax=Schizosaccharomyces cryophilus (strain OY26 / ATCC MYA-4695 / CBS 11777 / NBRC 106824 / NRRL Y48691) TaxID=653667 RepID=S9VTS2_SCHCR|nr:double-strand-specific ribonuclease Pac1 [Schizosaccharomyces cryophilus OY26]EPY49460.1 double-strand-specific ribonuclease Pac1 [Schizosaccharomyces cryophilus OY26]
MAKRHRAADSGSDVNDSSSYYHRKRKHYHHFREHDGPIKNVCILERKTQKLTACIKHLLEETKRSTKDDITAVLPGYVYGRLEGIYETLANRNEEFQSQSSQLPNSPTINVDQALPVSENNTANQEKEDGEYPPQLPDLRSDKLRRQVFTHISRAYELYPNQSNPSELLDIHNERLEFLGDSFFNMFTTRLIFKSFPQMDEGNLSKLRAKFVGNECADQFARLYGFDKRLVLSYSAEKDQLRKSQKVIADTFEAYVGALILDDQEEAAFNWVGNLLKPKIKNTIVQGPIDKLAKSKLFHKYSTQGHIEYRWVDGAGGSSEGYIIACIFNGKEVARAWGANQKDAGSRAAMEALKVLAKEKP